MSIRIFLHSAVLCFACFFVGTGCATAKKPQINGPEKGVNGKKPAVSAKRREKPNPLYAAIGNGVSLVYFEKDGCPACDKMDPVIEQVLGKTGVNLIKLKPCRRDIIEFGIGHYPTFVLYSGGKEYRRWIGPVAEKKLIRSIEKAGK